MRILVVDRGFERSLGREGIPDALLKGKRIAKGYARDLISDGHEVVVTCNYSHALEELSMNLCSFDLVIINYEEVDGGGLRESAIGQAMASIARSFFYAKMLIQMSQGGDSLDPGRIYPRFIALTPSASRMVRKVFEEAGFEVYVTPKSFRKFKRGLRRVVSRGRKTKNVCPFLQVA